MPASASAGAATRGASWGIPAGLGRGLRRARWQACPGEGGHGGFDNRGDFLTRVPFVLFWPGVPRRAGVECQT
eukprot:10055223-Alexandrium_andersonii.AAC.1